jgi:hypothetical protein
LRLVVVQDPEIFLLQSGDGISLLIRYNRIDIHHVRFDRQGHLRRFLLLRLAVFLAGGRLGRLLLCRRRRFRRAFLLRSRYPRGKRDPQQNNHGSLQTSSKLPLPFHIPLSKLRCCHGLLGMVNCKLENALLGSPGCHGPAW